MTAHSTKAMTRRCAECGNVIRIMAFLDDDFCSLDCRIDADARPAVIGWVAITEDTDG